MYWEKIKRTALYTFFILLFIAAITLIAVLFIDIFGLGKNSDDDGANKKEDTHTSDTVNSDSNFDSESVSDENTSDSVSEIIHPDTSPDTTETDVQTDSTPSVKLTLYDDVQIMYALYNVNARMSYTTESNIMGMIYQGDSVKVSGETDNGWYKVDFRGYTAYIRSDLLTSDAEAAEVEVKAYEKAVIMYASADVNVRKSHSTNSEILETIKAGTEVSVTAETSNGWYRIDHNGGVAYIKSEYLSKKRYSEDNRSA